MAQVSLNCPHCGGGFMLDLDQPLQTYWTCPYCGNRSLMQKSGDTIRLRSIISGQKTGPVKPDAASPWEQTGHTGKSYLRAEDAWPPPPPEDEPPRSLSDYIAEVDRPRPEPPSQAARPIQLPEADDSPVWERAEQAARNRQLPAFNSYARQAIDQKPDDRRMYAWRARLAEEADGFAHRTWASPVWYLHTPRQKAFLLAQHLYAYNTALSFSDVHDQAELTAIIGKQFVRQAVDHMTERAQLRCGRRWLGKTFKGRYRRSDLSEAVDFCDAIRRIDDQVCPLGCNQLKQVIRQEAAALPRKLSRRLLRF